MRARSQPDQPYRVRIRTSARASGDTRALRTRSALIAAAEELALEDPETLTAGAVAERAGVSRSAFYVHFDNVPDLAKTLLVERMMATAPGAQDEIRPNEWTATLRADIRQIVNHFEKHRALYRAVSKLPGLRQGIDGSLQVLTQIVVDILKTHPGVPPHVDPTIAARWAAGGAFSVFDAWIDGDLDADAEEIANQLFLLLPEWYRLEIPASPEASPGGTS